MQKRLILILALLLVCGSASAQFRRHDADRSALAKEAAEKFDAFSSGDSTIFTKMLANVDAIDARDFALLESRNQVTVESTITTIPARTWQQLLGDLDQTRDRYVQRAAHIVAPDTASIDNLAKLAGAAKVVSTAAADAVKKFQDREAAEAPTIEEFEKAVEKVRDALDMEGIDSLSKLQNIPDSLKVITQAIDAIRNPDGLKLEKLQLALDIAKAEHDRTKEELRFANERRALAAVMETRITAATTLEDRIRREFERHPGADRAIVTLHTLAAAAENNVVAEKELRAALQGLAGYVSLVGYDLLALNQLVIEEASARVRHSILLSQINSAEHAAFAHRGLHGVAAYYAGGLKPETVANVIDAIQTVVIGILASED